MKLLISCILSSFLICSCTENTTETPTNTTTASPVSEVLIDTLYEDTISPLPNLDLSIFGKLEYKSDTYENLGHELGQLESLGGVQIGQEQQEVIMLIGKPDSISQSIYWAVDGGEHAYWYYTELGLTVELMNMEGEKPSYVQTIEVKDSHALTTKNGISVGSDFNFLIQQYSKELMFIGSIIQSDMIIFGEGNYSVLQFDLIDNKVTRIYLGPTARC